MMDFSESVYLETEKIWDASLHHPFLKEMASGILPIRKFKFYCIQDYKYLDIFNKIQKKIFTNLPIRNNILNKFDSKKEIETRKKFFRQMNVSEEAFYKAELAPTTYNYTNHLSASFTIKPAVGLASITPCPWLYEEMGKYWKHRSSTKEMYNQFFNEYQSTDSQIYTNFLINTLNKVAKSENQATVNQMKEAFIRSSYYELQFWQMAYQEEGWN